MDETTAALLARFQRQMHKVDRLFDRAELKRGDAAKIESEQRLPHHQRPIGDETVRLLEASLLRREAETLAQRAASMQRDLYRRPPASLDQQIDDWIAGRNPDRDRSERER